MAITEKGSVLVAALNGGLYVVWRIGTLTGFRGRVIGAGLAWMGSTFGCVSAGSGRALDEGGCMRSMKTAAFSAIDTTIATARKGSGCGRGRYRECTIVRLAPSKCPGQRTKRRNRVRIHRAPSAC